MKRIFHIAAALAVCVSLYAQAPSTVEERIMCTTSGVDIFSCDGSALGEIRVNLRGHNGIFSKGQPLWIIDGVIVNTDSSEDIPFWNDAGTAYCGNQNSLLGINPEDIESVQILKNLSAIALYGNKGANGAVIIRTKRPREQEIKLKASANASIQSGKGAVTGSGFASAGFLKNGNSIYMSAGLNSIRVSDENSNTGTFRVNFHSASKKKFEFGINASASIGRISQGNWRNITNGDFDDSAREIRTADAMFFKLNLGKFFSLRADLGLDYRMKRRYVWFGPKSGFGKDKNGTAALANSSTFQYNITLTGGFERYFGKHHLRATLFADIFSENPDYNILCGYDFFNYTLGAKGINLAANTTTNRSFNWNGTEAGCGASIGYDLDEGTFGADVIFKAESNIVYDGGCLNCFPAVEVYFDFAKAFFRTGKVISSLKLHGGWAMAGSDRQMPYQWSAMLSGQIPSVGTDFQAFYDALLRVNSSEVTAGLHLGMFADRISLDATYYRKTTDETLSLYCYGEEFGDNGFWRTSPQRKIFSQQGEILNTGVEADIQAVILKKEKIHWAINAGGSYNFNLVTKLPEQVGINDRITGTRATSFIEGYRGGKITGFRTNEDGSPADLTNDGRITDADLAIIGDSLPKALVYISTSLKAGHFELDGKVGFRLGCDSIDYRLLFPSDGPVILTDRHLTRKVPVVYNAVASYSVPVGKTCFKPFIYTGGYRTVIAGLEFTF